MNILKHLLPVYFPLFFFTIALLTMYDYGMNWDSPIHFARGQAFLRYITTGKTNYDDLPPYCKNEDNLNSRVDYETGDVCNRRRNVRISDYESIHLDFSWAVKDVYGHPAFSNIMLAVSNSIFFKHLGWVEDIEAYHLYSLFTTFLLALTISIWTRSTFGTFASIIAVLVIYLFPLLLGEQHFNVKDPPMAAFFTISIYLFWLSFVTKKARYLILSALAGGASFGTKFNFVFAPFILLPWIITYWTSSLTSKKLKEFKISTYKFIINQWKALPKRMLASLIIYPGIVFLVFFLSWPAMWSNPINNITQVFKYYRDVGSPSCSYSYFTYHWFTECTQTITLKNLLYTIPLPSLALFIVGSLVSIVQIKKKSYITLLWLSFFLVTVIRVTFSISNIYGGLRQIMEFIAPFAMIAGVGGLFIRDTFVKIITYIFKHPNMNQSIITTTASALIIFGFLPITYKMIQMHPNQNVYFNSLIGGLRGASKKNFPEYGNTYGNAYLQGIKWLNKYSEPQAKLALLSGLGQNISRPSLREDISFYNTYLSSYNQDGEYLMVLVMQGDPFVNSFRYKYVYTFLNPVYDLKVEGVSLLTIWKNDKPHVKDNIDLESETKENTNLKFTTENGKQKVIISIEEVKKIKRLEMTFPNKECKNKIVGGLTHISKDGVLYSRMPDEINDFTENEIKGYNADFVYLFAGNEARYITITAPIDYPCDLSDINYVVYTFTTLFTNR